MQPRAKLSAARARLGDLERRTRPEDPEAAAALARRWEELPARVRTPAQLIGRRTGGCEGLHRVFPRCNFSCHPCYHSADANRVRVDGPHTLAEVERQMAYLRGRRGPGQYAQLIGGEVSLLEPEDHAAALEIMESHGRVPMSFTHGDFDYEHLRRVAVRPDGTPRFRHLSFAAHIDTTMVGRRGIRRPTDEAQLHPHRARFCEMFDRLRREHGISSYLAHNMTVTPDNVAAVPEVIRACRDMGWRMFSFQPAAYVGNQRRWADGYRSLTDDDVWAAVEQGAGTRLPYGAIQMGDTRCNRVTWGLQVGPRYVPVLDDADPADLAARDAFFATFPGNFHFVPRPLMIARVLRSLAANPAALRHGTGWAGRFVRRAGGPAALRRGAHPLTFVMHRFMDADATAAAWAALQRGERCDDPALAETQERLEACAYTMAHPERDEVVPACVQHSVLDPVENAELAVELPLPTTRS